MMIASSVVLLSLVVSGAVDGEVPPTPPPLPAPSLRAHHAAELPAAAPLNAAPTPPRSWYGWQLLLADAASFTLGITGKTGAPAVGATLGFTLAAPALHFAHGNRGIAVISLLVRSAMVGVAAQDGISWQGSDQASCHDDLCRRQADIPGLIFLAAGAVFVVVDDTFLSRADAPVRPVTQEHARRSGSWLALAPTLAPTSGGMSMGLAGRF